MIRTSFALVEVCILWVLFSTVVCAKNIEIMYSMQILLQIIKLTFRYIELTPFVEY